MACAKFLSHWYLQISSPSYSTCKTFGNVYKQNFLYLCMNTKVKAKRKTNLLAQNPAMFHAAFPSFIEGENTEILGWFASIFIKGIE